MIALDTSAIIAIARSEPEGAAMSEYMADTPTILIGMPTSLEVRMVLTGLAGRTVAEDALALILGKPHMEEVDFTAAHLAAATDAFDRYGKGRHPASPNYGECMAYAIAKVAGCPLLYKSENFARTDIRSAL